jgi:hypothetical protein
MISGNFEESTGRVASRMFEETAFIFTEPWEDAPMLESEVVSASIDFQGPHSGTVAMAADSSFCTTLAANFLGLEPDDPEAIRNGNAALGELLNIIAGALMEEWFGTETVCHIGIPLVRNERHDDFIASCQSAPPMIFRDDEGRRIDLVVIKK